jgi:four helix bundle protein
LEIADYSGIDDFSGLSIQVRSVQFRPAMNHTAELKARTAAFAKAVIDLCDKVQATQAGRTITQQLIDAATAVNANYRAACRARSRAEFISKVGTVCEEADECCGWLDLLVDTGLVSKDRATPLQQESEELTAIFSASLLTAKGRAKRSKAQALRADKPRPQSPIPE